MEPPGGTHTTTDLYSKLSADPTIFAKLRIKSEKADALAIGFDLAQWLRRQLFRTLSSALRVETKEKSLLTDGRERWLVVGSLCSFPL